MMKKLIIIDDSATQLKILKTLFENNGWEVCSVQNSKIGYEMIFDFAPDLIITDAIMPLMGGFQLIKLIRQNEKISKIPVIVYSVLNEANAKFYIKEEYSEYFLRKDDNLEKLLETANKIVEKYPLQEEYKNSILEMGLQNYKVIYNTKEENEEEETPLEEDEKIEENNTEAPQEKITLEETIEKIKKINDFSFDDEANFSKILNSTYEFLNFDLGIINAYSFGEEKNKIYFDIKNIILSPIFKNSVLNKFNTTLSSMQKKYAPNLKTIFSEEEFLSKIEFDFRYKEEKIGDIIFYSKQELKWDENELDELKNELYQFFKARYISINSQINKKEDLANKYTSIEQFKDIKKEEEIYYALIQINNFSEFGLYLTSQEIDTLSSKISEKIVEILEKDEQIHKNEEDEYGITLFASDKKRLKYRLEYILKNINSISNIPFDIDFSIIATSCNIDGNFSTIEAQKKIKHYLENSNEQEKVVIL